MLPAASIVKSCLQPGAMSCTGLAKTFHLPGITQVKLPADQGGGSLPQAAVSQGSCHELSMFTGIQASAPWPM